MKLNCDIGESFGRYTLGHDQDIYPHIHMANIACGFHAGDPMVMEKSVRAAQKHHVEIGAHPSYPDLQGFGRRNMELSPKEARQILLYQTGALDAFCRAAGTKLSYVKPHGALYNTMMRDNDLFTALVQAVADYNSALKMMVQATPRWQEHQRIAERYHVPLIWEGFADRAYEEDGRLRSRNLPGAVLSEEQILHRVKSLCQNKPIVASTGKELHFPLDALCVHGDTEAGIKQIATIRALLDTTRNIQDFP
ncbi:MAG: hypothetical protein CR981_03860 [Proteobacteria bacterium]|nr:MAG: hypothetical protein CR981_03860 [Pseudomonadota bacterium]PIE64757.1 MAG: hypothetical protein CSA26_06875 [Desulfobacterales bacterium]